jgi:hypothetical protein
MTKEVLPSTEIGEQISLVFLQIFSAQESPVAIEGVSSNYQHLKTRYDHSKLATHW